LSNPRHGARKDRAARAASRAPDPVGSLDQARQALAAGEPAQAEVLAARLLRADPNHADAALVLGHALLRQGRLAEAVEPLRRALKRGPDARLETLLGKALRAAGDRAAASEALEAAAARRPLYPLAIVELGELLTETERLDKAEALYAETLALAPEDPALLIGRGHLHLAAGEAEAALTAFEQAQIAAPGSAEAASGRARALALKGEHLDAAKLYARVLGERPRDARLRLSLAKSLLEIGRERDAEANLKFLAQEPSAFGLALTTLAHAPKGRLFLRRGAAEAYMGARLPTASDSGDGTDRAPVPVAPPGPASGDDPDR
jgi:tetratricopeptide (TPR) repeat protein